MCLQESLVHPQANLRALQVSLHLLLVLLQRLAARTRALAIPTSQPCRSPSCVLPKLVQAALQLVGSTVSSRSLLAEQAEAHLGLLGLLEVSADHRWQC